MLGTSHVRNITLWLFLFRLAKERHEHLELNAPFGSLIDRLGLDCVAHIDKQIALGADEPGT
jgi:hypothetical protein